MIVQTKETKAKNPLIELLGGSQKKGAVQNDAFSKLLATLAEGMGTQKNGVKTSESKTETPSPFNAVIDPKKAKESASLRQLLSGNEAGQTSPRFSTASNIEKTEETAHLQQLLSGNDEAQSRLFSKTLLDALSSDQVKNLIFRAKEYLKNEITSKAPELSAESKNLPKTLMGLLQLAEKMELNPQSITLSTLISHPDEQASFAPALLSAPLLDAKALSALPVKSPSSPAFEVIAQLLSEGKGKEVSSKAETPKEGKKEARIEQPLSALLQKMDTPQEVPSVTNVGTVLPSAEAKAKSEGLIALLQGESVSKEKEGQSVSGAKNDTEFPKTHQAPRADALEVKTKEASQSMRYFASDLKEAVQEYKPPFTRLTMTLNPEKLGEVEVTLVQRGNNVHVNIQSNNASSVAFLAHNATELKAQLAAQGITNATMNFMSGGEGQMHQQGQQQQQHNRFHSYQSLEDLELSQEQLSALEIIIPHYA